MLQVNVVKIGDVVHVRGTVKHVGDGWVNVYFEEQHKERWLKVPAGLITHVEPRPLAVGDKVSHRSLEWTVNGVDGDALWIKRDIEDDQGHTHRGVYRHDVVPL